MFSYPSILICVLGALKNCLIETVLLSTHNKCFGLEIRKKKFNYAVLSFEDRLSNTVEKIKLFH